MGTTATSLHILVPQPRPKPWYRLPGLRRPAGSPAAAVETAYARLGWARAQLGDAAAREAALTSHPAAPFVSLHDSVSAEQDDGTLWDVAVACSRALRTAAILTTITDGDAFSFVVFHDGRQIDSAGVPPNPALAAPRGRRQAAAWRAAFGGVRFRHLSALPASALRAGAPDIWANFIAQAGAASRVAAAPADRALAAWCRLAGLPPEAALTGGVGKVPGVVTRMAFTAPARPSLAAASAPRELLFDKDSVEVPYHGFFPAAWPVPASDAQSFAWPVICRGGGLAGFRLMLHMDRTGGFVLQRLSVSGTRRQGGHADSATPLARFGQTVADDIGLMEADLCFDTNSFTLPDPGPGGAYVLMIRAEFTTPGAGEIMITPSLRPDGPDSPPLILPTLRLAVNRPAWQPIGYQADRAAPSQRDAMLRLNAGSVHNAVAILADTGDDVRQSVRRIIERYVSPITRTALVATITTEKHRAAGDAVLLAGGPPTRRASQAMPMQTVLHDALWERLFDTTSRYQVVRIDIGVEGAAWPLGGISLHSSLRDQSGEEAETSRFGGPTLAAGFWTIAEQSALAMLGMDMAAARARFTHWVRGATPMQAWLADCAWIPAFDDYGALRLTPYEAMLNIDWFTRGLAGTLTDRAWLRQHLRFVAPKLWLGWELAEQVDAEALASFATVRELEDGLEVTLRDLRDMARLEAALLPVLPLSI